MRFGVLMQYRAVFFDGAVRFGAFDSVFRAPVFGFGVWGLGSCRRRASCCLAWRPVAARETARRARAGMHLSTVEEDTSRPPWLLSNHHPAKPRPPRPRPAAPRRPQDDKPHGPARDGAALHSWVQHRVGAYLGALRRHLPAVAEGGALASILEHCAYCGTSLGRVGLDFQVGAGRARARGLCTSLCDVAFSHTRTRCQRAAHARTPPLSARAHTLLDKAAHTCTPRSVYTHLFRPPHTCPQTRPHNAHTRTNDAPRKTIPAAPGAAGPRV